MVGGWGGVRGAANRRLAAKGFGWEATGDGRAKALFTDDCDLDTAETVLREDARDRVEFVSLSSSDEYRVASVV